VSDSYLNKVFNETSLSLRSLPYGPSCVEATFHSKSSGIYQIFVPSYSEDPFEVACDASTQDGGWTVILRRTDGSVDFDQNWSTYKKGFGDLRNEYFLGLDKIHALTERRSQELLIVLEDFEGSERYERYERFAIGDEDENYILHTLGTASGTAGDSLRAHHGKNFTTVERDNTSLIGKCAKYLTGGWWHILCCARYKGI